MERKDFEVQHKTHGYLYKMPELIDAMCKRLEKLHKDDHVIFFLDEIMAFGNPYSLDWTNLAPGPSISLLLAFSPVGLARGTKQILSNIADSKDSSQRLHLPESFEVANLHLRYRNSRSIQNFTHFIGDKVGKYLTSDEKPATDVVGDIPVWIDVATDKMKKKKINSI